MLLGGNEYYNLNLKGETFKIMAGFGGGAGVEEFCGAISGGVAVLGALFTVERGYDEGEVKEATKEFVESFREELSSTNCKTLKNNFRDEKLKCSPVVEKGAAILEGTIKKYREQE